MKSPAINENAAVPLQFVAYYTKGIGDAAIDELVEHIPTAIIWENTPRHAIVECPSTSVKEAYHRLYTTDDLRVLLSGPAIVSTPTDFAELCHRAAHQAEALSVTRFALSTHPWSITVSARRPAWRRNCGWDPAPIAAKLLRGADFFGKSRAEFDLRLQVDGETMHISGSLGLGRIGGREDWRIARLGALRPSVAAALVRLAAAGVEPRVLRLGVYDPFAGSGTVVAEACRAGLPIFASDIDPEAIALTRDRLERLGRTVSPVTGVLGAAELAHRVFVHDVFRGFPQRVAARILVANMPWGKQVSVENIVKLCNATTELVAVALQKGGACALLMTHPDLLISRLRKRLGNVRITSRDLGLLGQNPTIVEVRLS